MNLITPLSQEKDEFIPLDPQKKHVSMYTCGMTVYSFTHIGHLRAYLTSDVLKKYLEFQGYQVKQVMNITDVGHMQSDADEGEDKLEVKAKQENTTLGRFPVNMRRCFTESGGVSDWPAPPLLLVPPNM